MRGFLFLPLLSANRQMLKVKFALSSFRLRTLSGVATLHSAPKTWFLNVVLLAAVTLLYGRFLHNPLVFDDTNVLFPAVIEGFLNRFFWFDLRWFPYASLARTVQFFGYDSVMLRIGNLLLHAAVAAALFAFLSRLFDAVLPRQNPSSLNALHTAWYAFFAALIFSLHPVAVYGVGYLVQRSIVMTTLFCLLMWTAYLKGLVEEKRGWLLLSALFYFLAAYSKEHSVMAPGIAFALTLLVCRPSRALFERLWPPYLLYAVISMLVILGQRGVIGRPYEIYAMDMMRQFDIANAYVLSVITQPFLFFKYLTLWLIPNPIWMSVDMREPFATSLVSWPHTIGLLGFIAWGAAGVWLLLKRGRLGLLGFAMLFPQILFLPELTTVRIQEPFVLYRSYLWIGGAFAVLPILLDRFSAKVAATCLFMTSLLLVPSALSRLASFSDPLVLWDDAVKLLQNRSNLIGADRPYYNRGIALYNLRLLDQAINDFTKAIEINPRHHLAYNGRGFAKHDMRDCSGALEDFNRALALDPKEKQSYYGRGLCYLARYDEKAAFENFSKSCELGLDLGCARLGR